MFKTTYNGPTDTKGSSITATGTFNGRKRQKTIPFPYALSGVDCHLAAVIALCESTGNAFTRVQVDSIDRVETGEHPKGYTFSFINKE